MSQALTPSQRAKAVLLSSDFAYYAPRCLRIKDKAGAIMPFIMNRAQQYLHEKVEGQRLATGKVRVLNLKGRQQGMSTYWEGRFYWKTSTLAGKKAYILTHEQQATDNLFNITKRYHDNCPLPLRPNTNNKSAKALTFDKLDSEFSVATAGTKDTGRSGTGQYFHGSEVAFWANASDHLAGIGQTIPDEDGTEIALESTGNGLGNMFHGMWTDAVRGISDYLPVFIPWFWQLEYMLNPPGGWKPDDEGIEYMELYGITLNQAYWRDRKIANDFRGDSSLFDQEYPACVTGETRVGTDVGLIPIREAVKAVCATKGLIVATHPQIPSPVFKLTTATGYSVRGTWDHPVFSAGGVLVPLAACAGHRIQLLEPRLAEGYHNIAWQEYGINCSVTFNEDWGRFLGLYMGDGSLSRDTLSIVCDGKDVDLITEVKRLFRSVLGLNSASRVVGEKKGGVEVRCQNKHLIPLFDRFDLIHRNGSGGMTRNVHVPEIVWRSPKSVVREFLRGLFEADGFNGYGHARVTLFSKNMEFLKDVQLLLLAFGITCKRVARRTHNKTHEYVANTLDLRADESRLFCERIGFLSLRKDRKILGVKLGRKPNPVVLEDDVISVVSDGFEETFDLTIKGGEAFDANGIHTHNTPELAFRRQALDTLLKIAVVEKAMRRTDVIGVGPRIMGIDPSESETEAADDTVFCLRQGRRVEHFRRFHGKKTMEVVALAARAIMEWRPDFINVDAGGLGSGIADRLIELGYPVSRILFGERAIEVDLYGLRRDEMWGELAEWFKGEVQLPEDMAALSDLCAPAKDEDASLRFKLETKKAMKKRGLKSPDAGDALALTFAIPVASTTPKRPNRSIDRPNWRVL